MLISPDGARHRLVGKGRFYSGLMWSADSRTIYATSSADGAAALVAIDVQTDGQKVIGTYGEDVSFSVPVSPGLRLTPAPDGKSFLTTIVRTRSDLWILENFRQPTGWRSWFGGR